MDDTQEEGGLQVSIADIVKYNTESGVEITLTPDTVRNYLVSGNGTVTDQEVVMYLQLCRAQRLNPFLREAYLIKFGSNPASIVTGKETFLKRAESHPQFDGFEAGVTVIDKNGEVERREGALVGVQTERIIGGWARVHRKDRSHPTFIEVSFDEYVGKKNDGTTNRQWERMPATMIRKVPLVQALREAFPESFGGLYSPEEITEMDASTLPTAPVTPPEVIDMDDDDVMDAPAPQAQVETTPEPQAAVEPKPEPKATQATLKAIRKLKADLKVSDEQYIVQLSVAMGAEVSVDTELTKPAAEKMLAAYERKATEAVQATLLAAGAEVVSE
jgi:phage recombination protein Bet